MGDFVCGDCGQAFNSDSALGEHRRGDCTLPWDDPELVERLYWAEEMTMAEIAERWEGATKSKISYIFRKHDIPTRSAQEAYRLKYQSEVWVNENRGRMVLEFSEYGDRYQFTLARLIAMSEWSLDELDDHHVHHDNECAFDDRIENLKVLTPSEHSSEHDNWENSEWTEESSEKLREFANNRERDEQGNFI